MQAARLPQWVVAACGHHQRAGQQHTGLELRVGFVRVQRTNGEIQLAFAQQGGQGVVQAAAAVEFHFGVALSEALNGGRGQQYGCCRRDAVLHGAQAFTAHLRHGVPGALGFVNQVLGVEQKPLAVVVGPHAFGVPVKQGQSQRSFQPPQGLG
ncbi:hypothetical protein D3C72_1692800 [compost metagenome]